MEIDDLQVMQDAQTPEAVLLTRMQLLLAEKRTSLSVLRTGIGLLTLPMSIVAFLITMSGHYNPMHNLVFLIPLFALNTVLVILGMSLISRAWIRVKTQDKRIEDMKQMAHDQGTPLP